MIAGAVDLESIYFADPNTRSSAILQRPRNSSSRSAGMGISARMASFPQQFGTPD